MKKENMFLFYLLSFTWGLLFTLVGLIVLLFIRIFLNRKVYKYRIVAGRIAIIFKNRLPGGMNLGIVYIIDERSQFDTTLQVHEIGHSIQNAWFGPLFIFLIGLPSLIRASLWDRIRARKYRKTGTYPSYYDIWFEKQATELGELYVRDRAMKSILG